MGNKSKHKRKYNSVVDGHRMALSTKSLGQKLPNDQKRELDDIVEGSEIDEQT